MLTGGSEAAVIPSGIGGFIACKVRAYASDVNILTLHNLSSAGVATQLCLKREPVFERETLLNRGLRSIIAAWQALSRRNDAPESASRPWDKGRDGFVMGEGAGAHCSTARKH